MNQKVFWEFYIEVTLPKLTRAENEQVMTVGFAVK